MTPAAPIVAPPLELPANAVAIILWSPSVQTNQRDYDVCDKARVLKLRVTKL